MGAASCAGEWLVGLAAKGLRERDNHPMPKSVTTPEAFYEVMARAALDAMGLPALLERVARAERKLNITDEAPTKAVNGWADAATTVPDEQPVSPRYVLNAPPATHNGRGDGHGVLERGRSERGTRKTENVRLRR